MRSLALLAILSAAGCSLFGNDDAPQMTTVSAKTAKPGDEITITGVGLDDKKVDEVYLTDHKFDMRVKVLEQQATSIKMRVPPFAKPGRMQLLILTKGDQPVLLEQPVYVLIEEPSTQVSQAKEPAHPAQKQ
jgi:hypothetical protein